MQFTGFWGRHVHTSNSIRFSRTEKRLDVGLVKVNSFGTLLIVTLLRYVSRRRVKKICLIL
jgi:hypothetical protein